MEQNKIEFDLASLAETLHAMKQAGDDFLKKSKEMPGSKSARAYFDMAERAYRFAYDEKKLRLAAGFILNHNTGRDGKDYLIRLLLSTIQGRTKRSDLFRMYKNLCLIYEVEPMLQKDFFNKILSLGFTFKESSGEFFLSQPRNGCLNLLDKRGE